MKPTLIFFLSLTTFLCISNITSAQQSSLKQERADEREIKETINLFFEGMYDGNLNKMERAVWKDATLVSTFLNASGKEQIKTSTMQYFLEGASKPRDDKWDEQIWDLKIESEGRLAQAIMEYAFFLNDTFVHCGANAMQFMKLDGQWKIVGLSDTRLKNECNEKELRKRLK